MKSSEKGLNDRNSPKGLKKVEVVSRVSFISKGLEMSERSKGSLYRVFKGLKGVKVFRSKCRKKYGGLLGPQGL